MTQIKTKQKYQKLHWDCLSKRKKTKQTPSLKYRDIFFSTASAEEVKGVRRQGRIEGVKKRSSGLPATHTALHTSETQALR